MSEFLAITRERIFSPGRVEDDAGILHQVADHLRRRGHRVVVLDSDSQPWPEPGPAMLVFAMCQGPQALEVLLRWQNRGARIINAPEGIVNCQRHRTIPLLRDADVGLPRSILVDTNADPDLPQWLEESGAWIKRGDVHATEADDVVHVRGRNAALNALTRFRDRGIRAAVVQQHVAGVVLKFYAVRGRFFHCVQPQEPPAIPAAVLRRIDSLGQIAAARLGVEIYGGDCVYGEEESLGLIDLNDWPSYRACRAPAAEAIADYLQTQKVAQK